MPRGVDHAVDGVPVVWAGNARVPLMPGGVERPERPEHAGSVRSQGASPTFDVKGVEHKIRNRVPATMPTDGNSG